jgi:hypothetical protein
MMIKRKIKRAPLKVVRRHWADVGSEQEQTGGPPNLPASVITPLGQTRGISAAEPASNPPWLGKFAVPQPNGADTNELDGALGMFPDGALALPLPLPLNGDDCFDGRTLGERSATVVKAMQSIVEQMPPGMHSHMRQQLGMMKAMHECITEKQKQLEEQQQVEKLDGAGNLFALTQQPPSLARRLGASPGDDELLWLEVATQHDENAQDEEDAQRAAIAAAVAAAVASGRSSPRACAAGGGAVPPPPLSCAALRKMPSPIPFPHHLRRSPRLNMPQCTGGSATCTTPRTAKSSSDSP